jgi:outer membrane protein assembly factor BamE (lipoprotein component of BamABCDE complex)
MMKTAKTLLTTGGTNVRRAAVLTCTLAAVLALPAQAHRNPVDTVSNPDRLEYDDVTARRPDFDEPFLRDGLVTDPALMARIGPGLDGAQVRAALGEPLREAQGRHGPEWDYNLKLPLPHAGNYMVCQYKVLFDAGSQRVRNTVWRRRQCQDIVKQAQH